MSTAITKRFDPDWMDSGGLRIIDVVAYIVKEIRMVKG